jgi:hypothetical protein
VVSPFSVFYGGAITEHIGAFAQVTHNAPPPGGSTPGTKVLIDATFAAHLGGVGGYVFVNDMLYLEATGYSTLNFREQNSLGTDPFSAPGLFDGARAAFESHWANHWLEIGTFGMFAAVHPWADTVFFTPATFLQTDKYTDIGFDSQYQYQGENYWFTLRGSYIHEHQRLDATFFNGGSANLTNELNSLRLQASLAYGNDNRFVLTGQYFNTSGTPDAIRYSGLASGFSPNSDGWIGEIAYIPFVTSRAPVWPWFNARVGLQYIWYNKFDGDTVHARDKHLVPLCLAGDVGRWIARLAAKVSPDREKSNKRDNKREKTNIKVT